MPRVPACVETSANEYVGLTEAMGENLSQVWERSIRRAFLMVRRSSRALSSSANAGANWVRQNAANVPASIARAERCVRNVGSDTGSPPFKVYVGGWRRIADGLCLSILRGRCAESM